MLDEAGNRLLAMSAGKQWLKRNADCFQYLTIPHKLIHWDSWICSTNYELDKSIFLQKYASNPLLKEAMKETINTFLDRVEKNNPLPINRERAHQLCFDYLSEEAAVIMLMWQKEKYNYIVYPHEIPAILRETHEQFVTPKNPDLLNWLTLRLKTRKPGSPLSVKKGTPENQTNDEKVTDLLEEIEQLA